MTLAQLRALVAVVDSRSFSRAAELLRVTQSGVSHAVADPEMSNDSFRWIRRGWREIVAHRDGVTIDTSGTSRLMTVIGKMLPDFGAATIDRFWLDATRDVHVATAPVFGMLLVRDRLDMAQALAAGRAWQRLHLAKTAQGLAAQPLNQPIEMIDRNQMLGRNDEFGSALAAFQRARGWEADIRVQARIRAPCHRPLTAQTARGRRQRRPWHSALGRIGPDLSISVLSVRLI
jgi:hypothetical protein